MNYLLTISIIGIAALGMAWMPSISKKTKISYSIIYVLFGIIIYSFFDQLPIPDPIKYQTETLHITELVVIVSIMGTGLKIDQSFSFKDWNVPFRLIIITMLLCIGLVSLLGWWSFNFDIASALLLGAVLAPTDPVLASDVQVGPPLEKVTDNAKFSLTAEAGMNDGTAFPFTWLAILLASIAAGAETSIGDWIWRDLIYRIMAGVASGYLLGRFLAFLVFYIPEKRNFIVVKDGFVAIAATLLVYGFTELIKGYGFIAVFVCAITLRNYELHHRFHKKLHDFTDQIERMLVAIVLILFGGSIVHGILNYLTWELAGFALIFLFIIRPLSGLIALIGSKLHIKEKLAISFFGIRGMGSFFYLAFALEQTHFGQAPQIWSVVAFIVLISIFIHGLTATSVMKKVQTQFATPVDTDVT